MERKAAVSRKKQQIPMTHAPKRVEYRPASFTPDRVVLHGRWHVCDLRERRVAAARSSGASESEDDACTKTHHSQATHRDHNARRFKLRQRPTVPREANTVLQTRTWLDPAAGAATAHLLLGRRFHIVPDLDWL